MHKIFWLDKSSNGKTLKVNGYHTHVLVFCAYQLLILVNGYCCSLSSMVHQFFVWIFLDWL